MYVFGVALVAMRIVRELVADRHHSINILVFPQKIQCEK